MASGHYVPDEVTNQIVSQRLAERDAGSGWLLDGYPRTAGQVAALDQAMAAKGTSLSAVISMVAQTDELVSRLLRRGHTEGRDDDNAETIRHRMDLYHAATDPLLDDYRDRGLLVEVDGLGEIDEVAERITEALDEKLG
jgi:adenylate kinase